MGLLYTRRGMGVFVNKGIEASAAKNRAGLLNGCMKSLPKPGQPCNAMNSSKSCTKLNWTWNRTPKPARGGERPTQSRGN